MKKRDINEKNGVVTKSVLKNELKGLENRMDKKFATKNELKNELKGLESRLENRMDKKFATKKDLKTTEINLRDEMDRLENRVRLMIDQLERNIDEKNKKYRDEFLTAIDPILKEVLASREERVIIAHQVAELRDRVDEHEEKLKHLQQR
ncbi:hypothetical protein HYT17_01910 [Candidatus Microgenomates bacterium]|nr:hypothetical protein [Candidatus Microgenomates bacterium]